MHLGDLVIRQGFDGAVAWTDSPMTGKQILSGSAANALKQQSNFYGPLDLIKSYKEIAPTQIIGFDNKPCIEIKLASETGATSHMYVEESTSLIAGTKALSDTPLGAVEVTTYFRKYKSFDGYIVPAEIYVESTVQRQIIKIDRVSFESIPAETYAPPSK
jgi:hypothetical protein